MTMRITDKMLDTLAARLNKLTGSPEDAYSRDADGRLRANVGHYHISHAYGGVCLYRMYNEDGGVTCVSLPHHGGHVPRRYLWDMMHAYIAGIETARGER